MKPGIHPTWYPDARVTCACGNTWTTGSTKKEIHTDVCNNCHPFFTGEQRIVDTAGQVERFMKRMSAKEQIAATQPALEDKRGKKEKRRDRKAPPAAPAVQTQAPAQLPLAVVEERPAPIEVVTAEAPTLPVAEEMVAAVEEVAPIAVAEGIEEKPAQVFVEPVAVVEEKPMPVVVESVAVIETLPEVVVVEEAAAVAPAEEVKKKPKPRAAKAATTRKVVAKKTVAKKPAAKPKAVKKPAAAKAKRSTTKKSKK
ncbi:MAG: 50S ribosomal protein L31 [Chloroflexota bacterium]|nr:50S ribosomal protein L31 [Chloroflexota bacterium]